MQPVRCLQYVDVHLALSNSAKNTLAEGKMPRALVSGLSDFLPKFSNWRNSPPTPTGKSHPLNSLHLALLLHYLRSDPRDDAA